MFSFSFISIISPFFQQKIFVSSLSFGTLTDDLQNILTYMFTNSDINFLSYRTELSRPTPEKDLSTFIDQMQRVSVQVRIFLIQSRTRIQRRQEVNCPSKCLRFLRFLKALHFGADDLFCHQLKFE